MNLSRARAIKTFNGYIGEYRVCWRSTYQPVLRRDENGRAMGPEYFPTEEKAENAAWRAKNDAEQSVMHRSGEIVSAPRARAEALFEKREARG
jgi:hypothetical protein